MSKLTVFGSARADAFLQIPQDKVAKECNLDTHRCVIELSYAAKIPLDGVSFCVGGNGANVSVGVSRMGSQATLVAEIGEGIMSDYVMGELSKELDTNYISRTDGVPAGFGAVLSYQGERTILSYYPPHRPSLPQNLPGSEWAYLTSTGENFESYFEEIYSWISRNDGVRLAFNPGGRQIAKGREWLARYLSLTELLLVNREEGEEIVDLKETHGDEKKLLDSLSGLGAKKVVVTDGNSGAYCWDGKKYMKIGILPKEAVERTGAGDAFSTGCLAALMQGKELSDGLLWGTSNSTSVIGKIGPQAGLLKTSDLPAWLDELEKGNIRVEEF